MGAYGPMLFADNFGKDGGISLFQVMLGVQFVVNVWAFIIFLHGLGEVQGFSAWKALLNLIIVAVIWIAIVIIVGWALLSISSAAQITAIHW